MIKSKIMKVNVLIILLSISHASTVSCHALAATQASGTPQKDFSFSVSDDDGGKNKWVSAKAWQLAVGNDRLNRLNFLATQF